MIFHQIYAMAMFQLTAARRRLGKNKDAQGNSIWVSTHSRPKAAGRFNIGCLADIPVSTHSRPKAAGAKKFKAHELTEVSTHSRPKAAGANRRGRIGMVEQFQLTAARRRLDEPT